MKEMTKKSAIAKKGVRSKLMLAFGLMSIIPLLVCMYFVSSYIFIEHKDTSDVNVIILLTLAITMLGFILARKIVDPFTSVIDQARMIAGGSYEKEIVVESDDEVGQLGDAINSMTKTIRTNLDELKSYGQRAKEINVEINRKVIVLSSLLQIGDVITLGKMEIHAMLELVVQKASTIFDAGFGALYMPSDQGGDLIAKTVFNADDKTLEDFVIKPGIGLMGKAVRDRTVIVIDHSVKKTKEVDDLLGYLRLKSLLAVPIFAGRKDVGVLVVGSKATDTRFRYDDLELVKVFAKQIVIAVENNILLRKATELAVKDDLTDLYNKTFIVARLEEEIKRAIFYQRPCSFIVFNIDDHKKLRDNQDELVMEEVLKKLARLLRECATPVSKVARIGGDEFAILLPEKNKREATAIAEDVRKNIEACNFANDGSVRFTVSGGVGENPIDGATADEIFKKAREAVARAKSAGKNRVSA